MAELRRAIHSGWPKPARLGGHNALRGSRCRRPGPAPPPAVRRDRRRADGDARRAEGGALIRSSDSRVLLAEAVDCQNRTLSPSHQAVVRVRAQPQRTDASVRVHQRMLRACQMSVVSQDSNLAPCSSAAGLRAPAPRETAQSRPARPPPDRLALREELLEVRQRGHWRPPHRVVADGVLAVFARPPKRARFGCIAG